MRARGPLAPPIVVQQVELVSCGATCWKGREAPCGGGWEREQGPTRFGLACCCEVEPGPRERDLIPFETSGRGPFGVRSIASPAVSVPYHSLLGRHLNINTDSSQTHLSKHPKTPRSLSSPGDLSESAPRPLHYRVRFSTKSTSGLKAKRRSPRGSAPPPSPTRSLPLENAKAATGTG